MSQAKKLVVKRKKSCTVEYQLLRKTPDFGEKMSKVRAEKNDIQRRMVALEKKIQDRRNNRIYNNRPIEPMNPIQTAIVQRNIIRRRLARG